MHGKHQRNWNKFYLALVQYRQEHQQHNPPQSYELGPLALGYWTTRQRYYYHAQRLSPDRIQKLESLPNWTWGVRRGITTECQLLQDYITQFGHCNPPAQYRVNGFPLGKWIQTQRQSYRQHQMAPARIESLNSVVGWRWTGNRRQGHVNQIQKVGKDIVFTYPMPQNPNDDYKLVSQELAQFCGASSLAIGQVLSIPVPRGFPVQIKQRTIDYPYLRTSRKNFAALGLTRGCRVSLRFTKAPALQVQIEAACPPQHQHQPLPVSWQITDLVPEYQAATLLRTSKHNLKTTRENGQLPLAWIKHQLGNKLTVCYHRSEVEQLVKIQPEHLITGVTAARHLGVSRQRLDQVSNIYPRLFTPHRPPWKTVALYAQAEVEKVAQLKEQGMTWKQIESSNLTSASSPPEASDVGISL